MSKFLRDGNRRSSCPGPHQILHERNSPANFSRVDQSNSSLSDTCTSLAQPLTYLAISTQWEVCNSQFDGSDSPRDSRNMPRQENPLRPRRRSAVSMTSAELGVVALRKSWEEFAKPQEEAGAAFPEEGGPALNKHGPREAGLATDVGGERGPSVFGRPVEMPGILSDRRIGNVGCLTRYWSRPISL